MGLRRLAALALVMGLAFTGLACPGPQLEVPVCGNGYRETGEDCDDGNLQPGDGCDATCRYEHECGNGITEAGEECDDGNADAGDGCDPRCQMETGCGDGVLQVLEQCDDDNRISGDGCSDTCADEDGVATCGNGIWELGERCEDGNTEDGDGCDASCRREDACGDGVLEGTEACDDGNNTAGDGCSPDCALEFVCGDSACDTPLGESCERCPADCCRSCGNGLLEDEEQCDDGNHTAGDGCSPGCLDEDGISICGNGIWELGEDCDDGNTVDTDGCSAACRMNFECGDGFCDWKLHESCLLCAEDCCPDCGDGVLDPGEQCDGDAFGALTCESLCFGGGFLACDGGCQLDASACVALPGGCGDGVIDCGEDCDGDSLGGATCERLGLAPGTLACGSGCAFDVTGCGERRHYLTEGFEGGVVPAGWSAAGIWEVGVPTGPGPGAAYGGSACAGTRIDGDYAQACEYVEDWLQTPPIDLAGAINPWLIFHLWLDAAAGADGANVWISLDGGLAFHLLEMFAIYDPGSVGGFPAWSRPRGWQPMMFPLYAYGGSEIVLRFAFRADGTDNAHPGAYVDDVLVTEPDRIPVELRTSDPLPSAAAGHPYAVQLGALGGAGELVFTVVDGSNIDWIERDAGTGEIADGVLTGTPDASEVGPASITIRVEAQGDPPSSHERTFALEVGSAIYFTDFEGAPPAGWTIPPGAPPDLPDFWQWGTALPDLGPEGCHSGTGCLGTVLVGSYDASLACPAGLCTVTSPPIDLTTAVNPVLRFWQWIVFAPADGGYLGVKVDGGQAESVADVHPQYNGQVTDTLGNPTPAWVGDRHIYGWHEVTVDLAPYVGSSIQLTFTVGGSAANTDLGWYLDDLILID